MHVDSLRHRVPLVIPVLWVAVLLAVCGSGVAIAAASPSTTQSKLTGTWSGQYSGAYSGTFTLHWRQKGSKLIGSITLSNPGGKYGVTGSVHHGVISFGAVGAGATYTGTVSGSSMSGKYKTGNGGGSWSAHKTS